MRVRIQEFFRKKLINVIYTPHLHAQIRHTIFLYHSKISHIKVLSKLHIIKILLKSRPRPSPVHGISAKHVALLTYKACVGFAQKIARYSIVIICLAN